MSKEIELTILGNKYEVNNLNTHYVFDWPPNQELVDARIMFDLKMTRSESEEFLAMLRDWSKEDNE